MISGDGGLTVLVVDDDEVDRTLVRRLLGRGAADAHLVEAWDATEARRILGSTGVDAILLDYLLPGEDGLAFLRSLPHGPTAPPVVVLTGQGDERLAVAALKAGASDYLIKGELSTERLSTTLGNAISARRSDCQRHAADLALAHSHRCTRAFLACAQTLLLDLQSEKTLERGLLDLLRGLDGDRLCLLRSDRPAEVSGWRLAAQAATVTIDPSETLPDQSSWRPTWQRWQATLAIGETLLLRIDDAVEAERLALEAQGVRATMAVPFYLHGRWAGCLRCDRLRSIAAFSAEDARFLQAAGDILTVWIEKREPL
jgi:CheY-like chemotaxis protein